MPYKDPQKKRDYDRQRYLASPDKYQAKNQKWRSANPDRVREQSRAWRANNSERKREIDRQWRADNPERVRRNHDLWAAANPHKVKASKAAWVAANPEVRREVTSAYRKRNLAKHAAKTRRRTATKLQRTPAWADHAWIKHAYEVAADMTAKMGEPFHVDHIIPLQGKRVSGLHVYENLQILPESENRRKSNTFHGVI